MDDCAFEKKAVDLRRRAVKSARQCGLSDADAEDIAQEVMLRLWQMRGDLDRFASLPALASLIARRLVANERRRKPLVGMPLSVPDVPATGTDPSTILEGKQNEEWLDCKMKSLPATWHTILYMRQVERRGSAEIAELLGLREPSVRTLLAKARKTLLEEMRKRH